MFASKIRQQPLCRLTLESQNRARIIAVQAQKRWRTNLPQAERDRLVDSGISNLHNISAKTALTSSASQKATVLDRLTPDQGQVNYTHPFRLLLLT